MISCPVCENKRAIGKVGSEQYFCWDCCVEFIIHGNETTVFSVEPDGTLTLYLEPSDSILPFRSL